MTDTPRPAPTGQASISAARQPQQAARPEAHEDARRAISRSVVALLKTHLGRGPVRARTYLHDDSVLVLMSEGHTQGEETLRQVGEKKAVAALRVSSSEAIRGQLVAVVEAETGRRVIGYMSSSQQEPSLLSYVFVLDSTDLLGAADG
jgi:uncharacterized protein YbcI